MSETSAQREMGYVVAKLEDIDRRLSSLAETQKFGHDRLSIEVTALKTEVRDYTSQWKAVRWVGMAVVGIVVFIKTGSTDILKAFFTGGS